MSQISSCWTSTPSTADTTKIAASHDAQGGDDVADEVGVPRTVDDVDLVAVPLDGRHCQGHGDLMGVLLRLVVGGGRSVLDAPETGGGSRAEEQGLGEHGLPGPTVADERDVAYLGRLVLFQRAVIIGGVRTGSTSTAGRLVARRQGPRGPQGTLRLDGPVAFPPGVHGQRPHGARDRSSAPWPRGGSPAGRSCPAASSSRPADAWTSATGPSRASGGRHPGSVPSSTPSPTAFSDAFVFSGFALVLLPGVRRTDVRGRARRVRGRASSRRTSVRRRSRSATTARSGSWSAPSD